MSDEDPLGRLSDSEDEYVRGDEPIRAFFHDVADHSRSAFEARAKSLLPVMKFGEAASTKASSFLADRIVRAKILQRALDMFYRRFVTTRFVWTDITFLTPLFNNSKDQVPSAVPVAF